MSEKWEFVAKGGKHRPNIQVSSKEIKQMKENNLNGNRFKRGLEEDTDESISPEINKITKNKNKGKVTNKNDNDNLNQQINKLNGDAIKTLHKELLEKFPNQHTVVLMDLAVHINLMLKVNDEMLKNVTFDNIEFPYGLLSNETKSSIRSVFNGLNNNNFGNFLKSAIGHIIDDNDKGTKSIGLMMLLQVLLKMKPTVLIANRKTIFDILNNYREQTVKFKCIVWVIKQACTNYNIACQIWLVYLLPFISQRCHTETVLTFGEEMMSLARDGGDGDASLLATDFMPLVDLVFNQNKETESAPKKGKKRMSFQLAEAHVQRLADVYRTVKEQIFSAKASGNIKDYFASFFLRLSTKTRSSEELNTELMDCLEQCLVAYPDSVKQLDHLYQGYPLQTKVFVEYMSSHKSVASAMVTKQRSYKAVAEKMLHRGSPIEVDETPVTMATPATATATKKAKRQNRSSSTGGRSCAGLLLTALLYLVLATAVGAVVLHCFYPQRFNQVHHFLKERAEELRLVSRPLLGAVVVKVHSACKYVYGRVDEVAPHVLEAVADAYLSLATVVKGWYRQAMTYAGSPQVQEALDAVVIKATDVATHMRENCQLLAAHVLKVVGY